jgi:hypothetical protein
MQHDGQSKVPPPQTRPSEPTPSAATPDTLETQVPTQLSQPLDGTTKKSLDDQIAELKERLQKTGQWMEQVPGQGTVILGAHHALEHARKLREQQTPE